MSDLDEELKTAEEAIEDVEQEEIEEQEVDNEEEPLEDEDPEVVERAKKYGHLSKKEWIAQGKDPSQWKSAQDFDKTGKVIGEHYQNKWETLQKKVDQRDREIQALVDYQARTSQREYERARQDLEQRLAQSKNDFDMNAVSHYTKELTKLETMEQSTKTQHQLAAQKSAQERFIERNQHWFNDRNVDLKNRAIEIDNELKNIYPNATYDELAAKIEARMQYEHPERVLGQRSNNRPNISSSQSSVNKTAVNKSSIDRTFQGLSQDLRDTYSATKRIVESRGDREYTKKDFIDQLKKDGELA